MGSEGSTVTLFRTDDGHRVSAGCWTGTLDEMRANVTDGAEGHWGDYPAADRERWTAEFLALAAMFELRAAEWDAERNEPAS